MNKKDSVLIIVYVIFILSCSNADKQKPVQGPPPAINVNTAVVSNQRVTGIDTYPGNVVALKEVEIRAEVNGYITGIFVADGQAVRKGQKLYEIDRSRYAAAYSQAEAQVEIAKSNLQKLTRDLERYTRLAEQDAIARQRLDYASADRDNASSQLRAAEAALANALTDLNRSVIVAPFDGTIGIAAVRQGSLVNAGSTFINTISSPDPVAVEFSVGEHELSRFIAMQKNRTIINDSTFTIGLPDGQHYSLYGKVSTIDRAIDPQTGTIKVRIRFANPGNRLRPGMSCTVRVLNEDTGNRIAIPYKSVTEQLGEFFVYVVSDSNTVTQQRIVPGTRIGSNVVIREGLNGGETIVVEGVQNLRPGAKVNRDAVQ